MAVFPLAKLGTLVIKQVAKPLANIAKSRAKNSHVFRTYVLMPPAQFYHWCEVRMKMYVMNIGSSGKGATIPKLNEEAAIELGANLLGEGVIFAIAVAVLGYEVSRQSKKEKKKEEAEADFINSLEHRINELCFANEELDTKVRELTRAVYATQSQIKLREAVALSQQKQPTLQPQPVPQIQPKDTAEAPSSAPVAGVLTQALVDVKSRITN